MDIDEKPICPRCGIGIDHDRDGNCAYCARLPDEVLGRIATSREGVAVKHAKNCGIRHGHDCDCVEEE